MTFQATSVVPSAACSVQAPVSICQITSVPSTVCAVQAPVSSSGKHLSTSRHTVVCQQPRKQGCVAHKCVIYWYH